jgi:hypothetical protein
MTPTPEQVSAAREWLLHRTVFTPESVSALLAAREAEAYKRGWEACREKAVVLAEAWGGPPALPNSDRIAHALATLIRALEVGDVMDGIDPSWADDGSDPKP